MAERDFLGGRVEDGAFSGEKVVRFGAYDENRLREVSIPVPIGYVHDNSVRVRVVQTDVNTGRAKVLIPVGGCGDFEQYSVPIQALSRVA